MVPHDPPLRSAGRGLRVAILLGLAAAAFVLGLACSGSAPRPADEPPTARERGSAAPVSAAGGTGLLIARNDGIVLRSMADGSERLLKASVTATTYTYPRWSPDGRRIAYAATVYQTRLDQKDHGTTVQIMAPDGSGEQAVLKSDKPGLRVAGLAWAPDGQSLYVATVDQFVDASLKLERLDLTGKRTTVVERAAYPAVAPDGRIAFLTFSTGTQPGGLWLANADGSDWRLVMAIPGTFAGVSNPRFSPDGRQLIFGAVDPAARDEVAPSCPTGRRRPWQPRIAAAHGPPIQTWAIAVDGGPPRRLIELVADDPAYAWSPDGAEAAMIAVCGLYTIRPSTGEVTKIGQGAVLSQVDWR